MSIKQHRLFHGKVLVAFAKSRDIDPTKENIERLKEMFKKHFEVESLGALSDKEYSDFIAGVIMICAREFGVDIIHELDKTSMNELLNTVR